MDKYELRDVGKLFDKGEHHVRPTMEDIMSKLKPLSDKADADPEDLRRMRVAAGLMQKIEARHAVIQGAFAE
jgi:hypothetical protein